MTLNSRKKFLESLERPGFPPRFALTPRNKSSAAMELQEIKDRVLQYLESEILSPGQLGPGGQDEPLISAGLMNSLSTLKLVSFLEETFGVELAAHEIGVDCLDTVSDIAGLVQSKLS